MSVTSAKNKMCAVKKENKMSVVEGSLQENKISVVEGDNSINFEFEKQNQNHPRHSKPKLKTEIGFGIGNPSASLDMTGIQPFCAVLFNIMIIISKIN